MFTKKDDDMRLPFPFNLIPYFVMAVFVAVLCVFGFVVYTLLTTDMTPESIGKFGGEIVRGFNEAAGK